MNKKGGMLPSTYLIGIIIFAIVIVGGINMVFIAGSVDPNFVQDDKMGQFNTSFNKYNEIINQSNKLHGNLESLENSGVLGALNALITNAWTTLRVMVTSFSFMNTAWSGLSMFGVPVWVPVLIISIVTVSLVFAIMAAIFQREL